MDDKKKAAIFAVVKSAQVLLDTMPTVSPTSPKEWMRTSPTSTPGSSSEDDVLPLFFASVNPKENHEEWPKNKRAKVGDYMQITSQYSDVDFKSHFRMSRTTIEKLIKLQGEIAQKSVGPGRPPVDNMKVVLASIWVLTNQESFLAISDRFGLSKGHLHGYFFDFCDAVFNTIQHFIRWPTPAEMINIMEDFKQIAGFPGVIGAVDGCHIPIKSPERNSESYYNRKGFHSVLLQGTATRQTVFIDVFVGWPGSSHDARVWKQSPLYKRLTDGSNELRIPDDAHLLGDVAYPLEKCILSPYPDNGYLNPIKSNYNKKHSSTRVAIERAFGQLKGRFRRLNYLDMSRMDMITKVIITTCCLHNLCIEQNDNWDSLDIDSLDDVEITHHERQAATQQARAKRDSIAASISGDL